MSTKRSHSLFTIPILVAAWMALIGPSLLPVSAENSDKAKNPKIDTLDRFDIEQSPLQKGMLDARDKRWRKNLKLGTDPACSQLIRVWAKDDQADETNKTVMRHCMETDPDTGEPYYPGRDVCLSEMCGAENLDCAKALISGVGIRAECSVPTSSGISLKEVARVLECENCSTGTTSGVTLEEVTHALDCAEEIFENRGAGNKNRVEECLEDPFRHQDKCDEDPECVPELKGNCKQVFEVCNEVPFLLKSEKKDRRSGDIVGENGKKLGKRIQTSTVIHYDNATQRGKADSQAGWNRIRIQGTRPEKARYGVPGEPKPHGTAEGAIVEKRVLGSDTFNQCDSQALCRANDDKDCVDSVTGKHYTVAECFNGAVVGISRLVPTLVMLPASECGDFDICCQHVGPTPNTSYCSETVDTSCSSNADCPPGEACQPEDTDRLFYGDDCLYNPDPACTGDGRPCVSDDDCETGATCEVSEQVCSDTFEPCVSDTDCQAGAVCVSNLRTTLVQLVDEDPVSDERNSDGDCLDPSGYVTSECLDGSGEIRPGFTWAVDEEEAFGTACPNGLNEDGDCLGAGGRIGMVIGDQCVDLNGEVIQDSNGNMDYKELIDEDCLDDIDDDADGISGEDPPGFLAPLALEGIGGREEETCRSYYTQVGNRAGVALEPDFDAEGNCELTRAMRVHVNSRLKKLKETTDPKFEKFNKKTNKEKFFDTDAKGEWCGGSKADADDCPTDAPGMGKRGVVNELNDHQPRGGKPDRSYKYEERQVTVDEVFGVKCRPVRNKKTKIWVPTHYDEETGNCVTDNAPSTEYALAMIVEDPECLSDQCRQAMMGFTFAPPVLEWGWRIKEEVCVFGFCFEIFYARIGYEFDLAAGIRLPVEIQFDDVPEEVLATQDFTVETHLTPLDFDFSQYSKFCELHDLDSPWYIANCEDRFAFPDFLDASDGDEFVAQYSVFAGVIVRLFYIPLINWAIDSGVNVPAMCTIWKMKDGIEGMSLADLIKLELGLFEADGDVLQVLKDNFGNCGSFTTPWGYEECSLGDPGCPLNPPQKRLRAWPFLSFSKSIRADCFDALLHGEVVTVKGKKLPICTGLILGTSGASLGVGLKIEANAGSELITTDFSTGGDAAPQGPTELSYVETRDDPPVAQSVTVTPDNYDPAAAQDNALLQLNDFTYYLNAMEIALSANLEFGGILSPIPDIGSFLLYSYAFSTGKFGIPIPQHPNTGAVTVDVPVENYALTVEVLPDTPASRQVTPGCETDVTAPEGACPDYPLHLTNIGSRLDSFDEFGYELSNRKLLAACPPECGECGPEFAIDYNNDHDCMVGGEHFRGDPFDGVADPCYDACGRPLAEELINEDLPGCIDPGPDMTCSAEESDQDHDGFVDEDGELDDWTAAWIQEGENNPTPYLSNIPPHTLAPDQLSIRVSPLQHSSTSPGIYPFRVTADSVMAKVRGLPDTGPGDQPANPGFYRVASPDIGYLEVLSFFDPRILVLPVGSIFPPGVLQTYRIEVTNGANNQDSIDVSTHLIDSNQAGCNLVELGKNVGCPDRAHPTVLAPEWITGSIPTHYPIIGVGLMESGSYDASQYFNIQVPEDWAGMHDTTYVLEITVTSTQDPGVPRASMTLEVPHTVQATLESRTRFIQMQIDKLLAEITLAKEDGMKTAGLLPITLYPASMTNQRALQDVLDGNPAGALNAHAANIHITEAFLHVLDGFGGDGTIPEPFYSEWKARAEAIIGDLHVALGQADSTFSDSPQTEFDNHTGTESQETVDRVLQLD